MSKKTEGSHDGDHKMEAEDTPVANGAAAAAVEAGAEPENNDLVGKVVLVGAIGIGAALIESVTDPRHDLIGAAAIRAPKFVPERRARPTAPAAAIPPFAAPIGSPKRPARLFAEAQEQVQDIMAEARHEDAEAAGAATPVRSRSSSLQGGFGP